MERQLLYVSTPVATGTSVDLDTILATSRRNNPDIGVTGLLTFCNGRFVQVLEGEAFKIDILLETIAADPRHTDIRILSDRVVPTRCFGRWAMAHVERDRPGLERIDELALNAARSKDPKHAQLLTDALARRAVQEVMGTFDAS